MEEPCTDEGKQADFDLISIYESDELQEVFDILLGKDESLVTPLHSTPLSQEDIALFNRIERKVRNKLKQKGTNYATQTTISKAESFGVR